METKTDITATVNAMLGRVMKTQKPISPEKNLTEDLGLTSLQLMELLSLVEDEYDILIPVNRVLHVKTVGDLYRAVEGIDGFE